MERRRSKLDYYEDDVASRKGLLSRSYFTNAKVHTFVAGTRMDVVILSAGPFPRTRQPVNAHWRHLRAKIFQSQKAMQRNKWREEAHTSKSDEDCERKKSIVQPEGGALKLERVTRVVRVFPPQKEAEASRRHSSSLLLLIHRLARYFCCGRDCE